MKASVMVVTAPFSLRLNPELRARLETEAKQADRSASYIVTQAIKHYLDSQAAKHKAIQAAIAQADLGHFISSEAVSEWVDSWGTDNELPKPNIDITSS